MPDFVHGETLHHIFTSRDSTGAPTTLSGSPAVSVYEDTSNTEINTGVTLEVDIDSRTGANRLTIDTSGSIYEEGKSYFAMITAGTVDGVSVVGEIVYTFTLQKETSAVGSALMLSTPIDTVNSQTEFELQNGSSDNDIYNDCLVMLTDITTNAVRSLKRCTDYVGSTKTITIDSAPSEFTVAANDRVTVLACTLVDIVRVSGDVAAADNLEADYDGTGYNKSNSTVGTVTTNTDMRGTDSAALASVCTEARLAELDFVNLPTDVAAVKTDTAAILVDTADMQPKLGSPAGADMSADIAAVKTDTAAILVDTSDMQPKLGTPVTDLAADIAALNDLAAADVLTQVNAALDTAIAELGVGVPAATPTLRTGLMLLYMELRNLKGVKTSTTTDALEIANDAGTVIAHKDVTDDGTDYSEAKMQSGATT